ncbi:MAG: aminotransferase [Gammaproteobacteria bacterium]|nr:aminotransferase [Gammaproteobacteria bacterium]
MTNSSQASAEVDKKYVLHPYTNLSGHKDIGPFTIVGGEGIYVDDDQGNRLIEAMSGLWCTSLGFSESRLVDAAMAQFKKLPYSHLFGHRSTQPAIELSERLVEIAPEGISRAYLVNSGSEAVDSAIKMVWYYNNALDRPKKKKIISRKRAYHGVTVAAGSLTALPYVQDSFDLPAIDVLYCETPHYYRYGRDGESETEFTDRIVKELEQQIIDANPDTVAAFFAEPVMGAGGVLIPPAGYFEKVQALLKKYDILFVADEVICGFGRTGNMWGCDTYDIKPDMITCAKQLSSAYQPIGAVLVSEKMYSAFVSGSDKHGVFGTGNTYGGHPVASAVALETLNIYRDDKTIEHVQSVSKTFLQRLKEFGSHPLVGEARGVGLIGALEFVKDKSSKEQYPPADKVGVQVMNAARTHGLITRALPGDGVAICPPLIITEVEINEMFDRYKLAVDEVYANINA